MKSVITSIALVMSLVSVNALACGEEKSTAAEDTSYKGDTKLAYSLAKKTLICSENGVSAEAKLSLQQTRCIGSKPYVTLTANGNKIVIVNILSQKAEILMKALDSSRIIVCEEK